MKQQADKQRSERAFEVGDWVFLKLQSAALQTYLLRMRKSLKLSARYYGPFQVFAKIGQDTYKLQLPPNCIIHPVFHVSLLKKKIGDNITLMPNLPTMSANNFVVAPESILQTRTILRNWQQVLQGLVNWVNLPIEDVTWEDQTFITAQFPDFTPPWGQEGSHRGCIVTYNRKKKK